MLLRRSKLLTNNAVLPHQHQQVEYINLTTERTLGMTTALQSNFTMELDAYFNSTTGPYNFYDNYTIDPMCWIYPGELEINRTDKSGVGILQGGRFSIKIISTPSSCKAYVNSNLLSYNYATTNIATTVTLFHRIGSGASPSLYFQGKVYGVKKTNNNNIEEIWYPCYRKSDRAYGFYLLKSNNFFGNINITGGKKINKKLFN